MTSSTGLRGILQSKRAVIGAFILLAVVVIVTQFVFKPASGGDIKVRVSAENFVPVLATEDLTKLEQIADDGEWVEESNVLFRIWRSGSAEAKELLAETSGVFYGAPIDMQTITKGALVGFIKIRLPANTLHLSVEQGQRHSFNIGDPITLINDSTVLQGKVTLLLNESAQGGDQKIGIAYSGKQDAISLVPGAEFTIQAFADVDCQTEACG